MEEGKNGDDPGEEEEPGDKAGRGPKPGETPEEAARRILRENADFEKGILGPGRIEYGNPEKDW